MRTQRMLLLGAALLLLTGCNKPSALVLTHLDPSAPAASGYPARPLPDQPSPLTERNPFGLFTDAPSAETIAALATAQVSGDGRYRASITTQGAWVNRVDGAWFWQIKLASTAATPPAPPTKPGQTQPNATQPAQTTTPPPMIQHTVRALQWTGRSQLLLRDESGTWLLANPDSATVTALPAALQGKQAIAFSPDGTQVLYYAPGKGGDELFVANADGSKPVSKGVNVTAYWDENGKLQIQQGKAPSLTKPPAAPGEVLHAPIQG